MFQPGRCSCAITPFVNYGTIARAGAAPLSAFPSWFIRMECERCGQERYTNEVHLPQWKDARLAEIVLRLHHEGCGGRPKLVGLVTNVAGGSQPTRRIRLLG